MKKIALTFIVLSLILIGIIGYIFFNIALNKHSNLRFVLFKNMKDISFPSIDSSHIELEDLFIESEDNISLHAYIARQKSHIWIINIHGYMGNPLEMIPYSNHFIDLGYNCLIPSLRCHGKSSGKYITMGIKEAKDIMQWIDTIIKFDPESKIIIFGRSMGAATAILTSQYKNSHIVSLIEDCGYTSAFNQFQDIFKKMFSINGTLILKLVNLYAKRFANIDLKEADALALMKNNLVPTLFIHGSKDSFVPCRMVYPLYDQCKSKKKLLIIEDADHVQSLNKNPKLYWNTIDQWIKEILK